MTSLFKKVIKIYEHYTTRLIRMFRNTQRHNYVTSYRTSMPLAADYCKLGHGRRLRCAFASPNPSAVVVNSCTHRRRRRDATKQFRLVGVGGVYWALRLRVLAVSDATYVKVNSFMTMFCFIPVIFAIKLRYSRKLIFGPHFF